MTNIDNTTNENDDFIVYYNKEINPLLGDCEIIKSRCKQKFWMFFWSALAINCINILFVLFNVLLREKKFDITDITTLLFFSILVILYPFYLYKTENKPNFVERFFDFFGDFKYEKNRKVYTSESIFIPKCEKLIVDEQIDGNIQEYHLHIAKLQSKVKIPKINIERTISKGIHISVVTPINIGHIIFWYKDNYNKNCNVKNLSEIKDKSIPVSNYFYIFSDNSNSANNLISVSFFEALLDVKEIFGAPTINVELGNKKIDIYMENAKFPLFIEDTLMKGCLQKEDFYRAYETIEKIIFWNETTEALSQR